MAHGEVTAISQQRFDGYHLEREGSPTDGGKWGKILAPSSPESAIPVIRWCMKTCARQLEVKHSCEH